MNIGTGRVADAAQRRHRETQQQSADAIQWALDELHGGAWTQVEVNHLHTLRQLRDRLLGPDRRAYTRIGEGQDKWKALIGKWQQRAEAAGYDGIEGALEAAEAQAQGGGLMADDGSLTYAGQRKTVEHMAVEIRDATASLQQIQQRVEAIDCQPMSTAPPSAPVGVADAWQEGYRQGVLDERTSEDNIGISGFNAKVEPARVNPYLARQPAADPHICTVCDGGPGNDGPCLCGERRWEQPAAVDGAALKKMATRWLFDDGYLTGDPKIDEPTIHRGSAKRECAQELINFLAAQQGGAS